MITKNIIKKMKDLENVSSDTIEENKTNISNLQELVGQANQTLIEECNKLLDI